jgi:hypothetical protein
MPTALLRLLLLTILALALAACGQAQSAVVPATVQSTTAPEEAAVSVVQALVARDMAVLLPLISTDMPMHDIEIQDKLRLWRETQARNGICGGPVTSVEAVETTERPTSISVRVLTRCTADGSTSLGRGGMDLTLVPVGGSYQVLDWKMMDGFVLRDQYADY